MKINADMLKNEEDTSEYQSMDLFQGIPCASLSYTISDIDESILVNFDTPTMVTMEQEETMDVAANSEAAAHPQPHQLVFCPGYRLGPPERHSFPGQFNFQVEINSQHTNKKKYLFSHLLNRIYVDMGVDFPVQFRWDAHPANGPMYVRATTVFSDESQQEKRVERCTQHTFDSSNKDLNPNIVKNVLRSSRQINTQGVFYCGMAEQADSWLSVVVEFPTHGVCSHAYQFVCKNSCCSGINRRAIDIVFELEDHTGKVHGRQSVGARVCACPRRDLRRDENEGGGAGKRQADPAPKQAKRVKQEQVQEDSDDIYTLSGVEVVGSIALLAGLSASLAVMEAQAASLRENPVALEKYTTRIPKLKAAIEDHKKTSQ